jgi:MOSC domain-containing protein YiiM
MLRTARVVAVNVVHELMPGPKETGLTAIDKRPREGRVEVGELGLAGDTQCDKVHHGGPDQALYVYAREDSDWWMAELQRDIPPGLFGENLDTLGLDVTGALIGERWRIGEGAEAIEVEVRSPRLPCVTFQARMNLPRWQKRFMAGGRPGAYLKVLRTGVIAAGDPITVLHRPDHDVTIGHVFTARANGGHDPDRMRAMLDSGIDLEPEIRDLARRVASRG